jgi:hypothetical protein
MNSHAEAKSLAAAAEVAASGGHEGARLVALRGLRLRTVIKARLQRTACTMP